jgi:hypothetical protein
MGAGEAAIAGGTAALAGGAAVVVGGAAVLAGNGVVWLSVVKAIARKQELVSNVFFIGVVCNEMRGRRRLDSGICSFRNRGSNDLGLLV